MTAANTLISLKQGETSAGNLEQGEAALEVLKATKNRYEIEASAICQTYLDAQKNKVSLETKKDAAKIELDEHTGDLLEAFQKRINQLLEMVTAGFRLENVSREYKGTESTVYLPSAHQ